MRATKQLLAIGAVLVAVAIGIATFVMFEPGEGSGNGATALQQAEDYERAVFAGDCAAVKKAVAAPAQIDCVAVSEGADSLKGIDVDATKYTLIDSAADTATVRVSVAGEATEVSLVKTGGRWLVALDTEE